jgi:hypothetical protein
MEIVINYYSESDMRRDVQILNLLGSQTAKLQFKLTTTMFNAIFGGSKFNFETFQFHIWK